MYMSQSYELAGTESREFWFCFGFKWCQTLDTFCCFIWLTSESCDVSLAIFASQTWQRCSLPLSKREQVRFKWHIVRKASLWGVLMRHSRTDTIKCNKFRLVSDSYGFILAEPDDSYIILKRLILILKRSEWICWASASGVNSISLF